MPHRLVRDHPFPTQPLACANLSLLNPPPLSSSALTHRPCTWPPRAAPPCPSGPPSSRVSRTAVWNRYSPWPSCSSFAIGTARALSFHSGSRTVLPGRFASPGRATTLTNTTWSSWVEVRPTTSLALFCSSFTLHCHQATPGVLSRLGCPRTPPYVFAFLRREIGAQCHRFYLYPPS